MKVTRKPVTGPSTTTVINITLGAGVNDSVNIGSLQVGSHVTTAQLFGGMDDSLLLLVQGNAASAIAFDDNDGIEYMSFLRSACGASCTIVVGHPQPKTIFGVPLPPTSDGPVRVVWDEDAEGPDSDEDHLGNRLEQAIGANPNRQDSDNDGVADGLELLGGAFIPGAVPAGTSTDGGGDLNNRLKFPLYGANPLVRDVFVEADWLPACRDSDPGGTCTNAKKDGFRVLPNRIGEMAGWVAPELVPHYDTGRTYSDPATGVVANDWGGANHLDEAATLFVGPPGNYSRIDVKDFDDGSADTSPDCKGFTPARVGLFHHFIVFSARGGARMAYACGTATGDAPTLLHELGHNLNLSHGGPPAKADALVMRRPTTAA